MFHCIFMHTCFPSILLGPEFWENLDDFHPWLHAKWSQDQTFLNNNNEIFFIVNVPECTLAGLWNCWRLSVQLPGTTQLPSLVSWTSTMAMEAMCLQVACGPDPTAHSHVELTIWPLLSTTNLELYVTCVKMQHEIIYL